ncbi:LmeA family phospholipid-binding protein [Thermanaerovibrio velox]|uniref:LmeA family phospholipid-binding protein n=1 Tax=Thermanaerovibrio velox TaxID=108007 RepID=UPI00155A2CEA|nr:LmeA family phospholipid-binding protein [Thermanaerovibrio velox]
MKSPVRGRDGLRSLALLLLGALVLFARPHSAMGGDADNLKTAQWICDALFSRFSPEEASVTVNGQRAFVTVKGLSLDGVRVERIRLDAKIDPSAKDLSSMVLFSRGELLLLEKDINSYFAKNEESGFRDLRFRLTPSGFEAQGIYSAKFIFNITVRLKANGVLALKPDGIYLDQVGFFVEGRRQPEFFTNEVLRSLNPILSTSDLPFPVLFKQVQMGDGYVALISDLIPLGGPTARRVR